GSNRRDAGAASVPHWSTAPRRIVSRSASAAPICARARSVRIFTKGWAGLRSNAMSGDIVSACLYGMPNPQPARSIRRHENRQAETGQMVQRLVDPDQGPEPRVLFLLGHAKGRCAKSLGAIDRDVDDKIDQGD